MCCLLLCALFVQLALSYVSPQTTSVHVDTAGGVKAASVGCVQLLSSGICEVRQIRGAKAHSRESKSRDKLLDTLTILFVS